MRWQMKTFQFYNRVSRATHFIIIESISSRTHHRTIIIQSVSSRTLHLIIIVDGSFSSRTLHLIIIIGYLIYHIKGQRHCTQNIFQFADGRRRRCRSFAKQLFYSTPLVTADYLLLTMIVRELRIKRDQFLVTSTDKAVIEKTEMFHHIMYHLFANPQGFIQYAVLLY